MSNRQIIEASSLFEKAFSIFNDIRDCLRMLNVKSNSSPIYESYEISSLEQREMLNDISDLKSKLTKQMKSVDAENEKEIKLYEIALKHIERYEPYLINESNMVDSNGKIIRTTNKLEQEWGRAKRIKRQVTGKRKLTREFNSLPKEYMIVQNLKNPDYVDLVLQYNHYLQNIAADLKLSYIDLYPHFINQTGEMQAGLSSDGLHLNDDGYEIWYQLIFPYLLWIQEK